MTSHSPARASSEARAFFISGGITMTEFLASIPAGTMLFGLVGIFGGLAVILAVTLFKCARGAWKLLHH